MGWGCSSVERPWGQSTVLWERERSWGGGEGRGESKGGGGKGRKRKEHKGTSLQPVGVREGCLQYMLPKLLTVGYTLLTVLIRR